LAQEDIEKQETETASQPAGRSRLKRIIIAVVVLAPALLIGVHEVSIRRFQDVICVVCHEMKDPVQKWQDSGTATNHRNCSGCHFDDDFNGWMAMNKSAVVQVIEHFKRDPEEPLSPPEEPLFLEEDKEPAYWSLVPNHRCFQCHDAPNHKPIDQERIHAKLIRGIADQPCKDCHNHEMRNGQKFFEKALAESETASLPGSQT
jgi:trimethylamine-N-oxide reductase (cytochrome c) cytochrome c-type subunit TorY